MSPNEVRAYNAGIAAMVALARAASDRLAARLTQKPTRFNFAIGALDALAEEGAGLVQPVPAEADAA